MWECSECSVENDLDPDAEEGQVVICMECDAEFEITSLDPLEVVLLELVDDEDDDDSGADDEDWSDEE